MTLVAPCFRGSLRLQRWAEVATVVVVIGMLFSNTFSLYLRLLRLPLTPPIPSMSSISHQLLIATRRSTKLYPSIEIHPLFHSVYPPTPPPAALPLRL